MVVTAEELGRLRDLTGSGLHACKKAAAMAEDPSQPFAGDLLWALCTVEAAALAVNVRPPSARAGWNVERGARDAARLRERFPELAAAFPAKEAGAAPTP